MIVSAWGMIVATLSARLQLSEALYPIIGIAIMAGPAVWGDRLLRRRQEDDDDAR
jgi:hypothetical protein